MVSNDFAVRCSVLRIPVGKSGSAPVSSLAIYQLQCTRVSSLFPGIPCWLLAPENYVKTRTSITEMATKKMPYGMCSCPLGMKTIRRVHIDVRNLGGISAPWELRIEGLQDHSRDYAVWKPSLAAMGSG